MDEIDPKEDATWIPCINLFMHFPPSSLPLMKIQHKSYQVQPIHMASNQQIRKSENIYVTSKLLVLGDFFHAQTLHTRQNNL